MSGVHLEFMVEPFVIAEPGPHVRAAVTAAEAAGLEPDMGPFATSATGTVDEVIDAVAGLLRSSLDAGATSVQLRVDLGEHAPKPGLHDALDRMISDVEREIGAALGDMSRAEKQQAVSRLDAQGAFLLRGSAGALSARMGISKVTLYAYLNAVDG